MQTRIASLVPSLTELLFALGLGPWVVARTGFCIHPAAEVSAVPKVGGTKDVNLAKLRRLAPTHVLVNVDENRLETVEALREFVPHIVVTHPCGPEDNLDLLAQMAQHFGALAPVLPRVQALKLELESALAEVRAATPAQPPNVLYLIWREPWMTVARDTYISRLLAQAGGHTWPDVEGGPHGAGRYPVLQGDEPWLAAVDEVWLSSEPYQFTEQHLAQAQALCPQARVRLVDGELLSWYGPRAAAGLRYAAQLLGGSRPLR
ncbi:helical backbone metal receptor [Ideonella sp.]|jgi:ABC-type Fe3+-hydroxamate transport system substrate-binding protein|uniref:helical backbone metal receptor n=1 Tax=Ideonella sp. TaxID=1929293 RepID=UPI0037C191CD